jgi:hypothetical protein
VVPESVPFDDPLWNAKVYSAEGYPGGPQVKSLAADGCDDGIRNLRNAPRNVSSTSLADANNVDFKIGHEDLQDLGNSELRLIV